VLSPSTAKRRSLPAVLAIAVGASFVLSSCAASEPEDDAASPSGSAECATAGAASDAVTVEGEAGTTPVVTFGAPLEAERTERTVLIEGDGDEEATEGSTVGVSYTLFHGGTGEEIESTGHGPDAAPVGFVMDEAQFLPGIVQALNCSVTGDRIVAVIPSDDAFGEGGNADLGVAADDSIVFVFDITDVIQPVDAAADMVVVEPDSEGMPSVSYADDGTPTVTFPDSEPLTEPTLAVITEGDGEVVSEGDNVEIHYSGVNWDTGENFDSSWSRGEPTSFVTSAVIPGFGAAIVGQTVGSQVIVVIPPAYGYGSTGTEGIGGTDTIVFAIDILGTTAG
jgi:FKBP-type peptidyl-prolyl cis-trans isomerase